MLSTTSPLCLVMNFSPSQNSVTRVLNRRSARAVQLFSASGCPARRARIAQAYMHSIKSAWTSALTAGKPLTKIEASSQPLSFGLWIATRSSPRPALRQVVQKPVSRRNPIGDHLPEDVRSKLEALRRKDGH